MKDQLILGDIEPPREIGGGAQPRRYGATAPLIEVASLGPRRDGTPVSVHYEPGDTEPRRKCLTCGALYRPSHGKECGCWANGYRVNAGSKST